MKTTIILLGEVEIEDEGFLSDYAKEELEAGRVSNLRLFTVEELVAPRPVLSWLEYLLPRFLHWKSDAGKGELAGPFADNMLKRVFSQDVE